MRDQGVATRTGKPFVVERVVRRVPLTEIRKAAGAMFAAKVRPSKDAPLAVSDVIGRVAALKDKARTLQGVGHTHNAHAFAEAKSELHTGLRRLEDDLRQRGVGNDA